MPEHSVDVAVVGAGLAGLVTARDVAAAGLDVLVLEARDRVGGGLLNAPLPGTDGEIVEAGGQWVGPGQDRIAALITGLGLATFPTYDTGDKLAELRGARTRYGGRIPRLNPAVIADIGQSQLRLDRAARRVPLDAPWTAPGAARLDGQTFATWLNRRAATASGRAFSRLVTEAVWAAEPEDMSALWALFYIHSGGGVESLINTSGGAQQDRIVGGSQRIALGLAAALGDRVLTGAPATESPGARPALWSARAARKSGPAARCWPSRSRSPPGCGLIPACRPSGPSSPSGGRWAGRSRSPWSTTSRSGGATAWPGRPTATSGRWARCSTTPRPLAGPAGWGASSGAPTPTPRPGSVRRSAATLWSPTWWLTSAQRPGTRPPTWSSTGPPRSTRAAATARSPPRAR